MTIENTLCNGKYIRGIRLFLRKSVVRTYLSYLSHTCITWPYFFLVPTYLFMYPSNVLYVLWSRLHCHYFGLITTGACFSWDLHQWSFSFAGEDRIYWLPKPLLCRHRSGDEGDLHEQPHVEALWELPGWYMQGNHHWNSFWLLILRFVRYKIRARLFLTRINRPGKSNKRRICIVFFFFFKGLFKVQKRKTGRAAANGCLIKICVAMRCLQRSCSSL